MRRGGTWLSIPKISGSSAAEGVARLVAPMGGVGSVEKRMKSAAEMVLVLIVGEEGLVRGGLMEVVVGPVLILG